MSLAADLVPSPLSNRVVYIGPNASWFRVPGGDRVSLARRHPLRRLLAALRECSRMGQSLDAVTAFEVGWQGERAARDAADARVYTAICTLRRMGLRGLLLRYNRGYILDCRVVDASQDSEFPPALEEMPVANDIAVAS